MEKRERKSWGRNMRRVAMVTVSHGLTQCTYTCTYIAIAIQNPLNTNARAEAMNPKKNRQVKSPSRGPPGAIGLATPFLRHLARPSAAEMREME